MNTVGANDYIDYSTITIEYIDIKHGFNKFAQWSWIF